MDTDVGRVHLCESVCICGSLPTRQYEASSLALARRLLFPRRRGDPVEVPDDAPVAERQLALEFLAAHHLAAADVDEAKLPLAQAHHREVGRSARVEVAEVRTLDLARRIPGRAQHHVLQ